MTVTLATSLLDIFQLDRDGTQTLVVTVHDLKVHEDHLQNYIEVICRDDIKQVFIPASCTGVALVIFHGQISDGRISKWQEQAKGRTFEGRVPKLSLLGQPKGVYLGFHDVSITEEALRLYFETRRSGGKEETVSEARITKSEGTTHAVVQISSDEAIQSILGKQDHNLMGKPLQLQPYYPEVHDHILQTIQTMEVTKCQQVQPTSHLNQSDNFQARESEQATFPLQQPIARCTPLGRANGGNVSTLQSPIFPSTVQPIVRPPIPLPSKSLQEPPAQLKVKPSVQLVAQSPVLFTPECPPRSRLQPQACTQTVPGTKPLSLSSNKAGLGVETEVSACVSNNDAANLQRSPPVNAVMPFQRQTSNISNDDDNGKKSSIEEKVGNKGKMQNNIMHVSAAQITMLKIVGFQSIYQTDSLKFDLDSEHGKITVKGSSDEEVKQGTLNVYECLANFKSKKEKLSESRTMLLKLPKSQNYLKSLCKKQDLKATFDIDSDIGVILWYSFNDDNISQGCQLLKNEICIQQIRLQPAQASAVKGDDWKHWANKQDFGVFVDEGNNAVTVEGFVEKKDRDLSKVMSFLNENCQQKTAKVELEGATARLFQACVESKLKEKALMCNGTFDVQKMNKSPLKLQILVEGEESLIAELRECVKKIWHESIDFDKISDKAEDKWLMFKGLNGPHGKQFFNSFEAKHNCFIDVCQKGEFHNKKPRVAVADIVPEVKEIEHDAEYHSDESCTGSDTDRDHARPLQEEYDVEESLKNKPNKWNALRQFQMQQSMLLQGNMSEEDAMKQAMEESLRDQGLNMNSRDNKKLQMRNWHRFHESVAEGDEDPLTMGSRTVQLGRIQVVLKRGNLVEERVDAMVNVVPVSGKFQEGVLSKSFLRRGGDCLEQMYQSADTDAEEKGFLVSTEASGRLQCKAVFHVKLQKGGHKVCANVLNRVLQAVLDECDTKSYTTLALPPLGVGKMFNYPPTEVAEQILRELSSRRRLQSLNHVTVVVYREDAITFQAFDSVFQNFKPICPSPYMFLGTELENRHLFQQQFNQKQRRRMPKAQSGQYPGQAAVFHGGLGGPQGLRNVLSAPTLTLKQSEDTTTPVISRSGRSGGASLARSSHHRRVSERKSTDRRDKKQENRNYTQASKTPRPSRFPDDPPVTQLHVTVIAENESTCIKARNALGKEIKEEFLNEEPLAKSQKISKESKEKIIKIILKHDIKSCKDKGGYTLKGRKENVHRAHRDILQVLLDEKQERKRRKQNVQRTTKEYAKFMYEEEVSVPAYWKIYRDDKSLKDLLISFKNMVLRDYFTKELLPQDSRTFKTIIRMINSTFDPTKIGIGKDAAGLEHFKYQKLQVIKIERIENAELYDKFAKQKQNLFRRLWRASEGRFPKIAAHPIETNDFVGPGQGLDMDIHPELNEVLLFHGTKKENVKVICNYGLDNRLGSSNSMLGPGIYGAECSLKADQYADAADQRSIGQGNRKRMFLMRMLLGNAFVCNQDNPHKYRRPPCTKCHMDNCSKSYHAQKYGHMHDSVIGALKNKLFREFVVYESSMCYPEYLITYERL